MIKIRFKNNKGITLIALVITIIVLLILAGVSIAMLTGQNGILTQANNSKIEQSHASVREGISLLYNEYQIQINTARNTKIASTETVTIQAEQKNALANTSLTFLQFLQGQNSQNIVYLDENNVIDVEALTGAKQALGNGSGTTDVYILKEEDGSYVLNYYDAESNPTQLWTILVSNTGEDISYNDKLKTLKPGDYVVYDTGIEGVGEAIGVVLYDANSEYGLQIMCNLEEEVLFKGKDDYNNAIKILNDKAMEYLNTDYAIDARCIGSNPKNKNAESSDFASYNDYTTDLKAADDNYETDYNTLEKLNIPVTEGGYWFASRYVEIRRCLYRKSQ